MKRPEQHAIAAAVRFHSEVTGSSSFNRNDNGIIGGYYGRAIMNKEVVAAVLRVKIDGRGPPDELWLL
jgi:hypothetical protein